MRDYLLLKNNFLYNSFNINYVMSICWSCGVELGIINQIKDTLGSLILHRINMIGEA